jgi:hypothetical protein
VTTNTTRPSTDQISTALDPESSLLILQYLRSLWQSPLKQHGELPRRRLQVISTDAEAADPRQVFSSILRRQHICTVTTLALLAPYSISTQQLLLCHRRCTRSPSRPRCTRSSSRRELQLHVQSKFMDTPKFRRKMFWSTKAVTNSHPPQVLSLVRPVSLTSRRYGRN